MGLSTEYLFWTSRLRRRTRLRACSLAVTGSSGKTTTASLLAAILAAVGRVRNGSVEVEGNSVKRLAATILGARPEHDYIVAEFSGSHRGVIERKVAMLRPDVGIVTRIGVDHRSSFPTLEDTANEKSVLIRSLPADGLAVLNADDRRVWEMGQDTRAMVVGYGRSPEAAVRLLEIHARWPDRLSLRIAYDGHELTVPTNLVGGSSAYSVLAALAAAVSIGVPIAQAARTIASAPPIRGRFEPHFMPGGYTVIDDAWKAPIDSFPPALEFVEAARAARKIVVVGEISDTNNNKSRIYRRITRSILAVADVAVVVGAWAHSVRKLSGTHEGRLHAFDRVGDAAEFLRGFCRHGDLVLIKGAQRADHFERLYLEDCRCWKDRCPLVIRCSDCDQLRASDPAHPKPAGAPEARRAS